jgi:hypothetical protein
MEGDDRFGRRWLSHWITAILFSVIFFCVLNCFGPPFLLRALDRAGSDAVIRGYAPDVSEMDLRRYPRIVVVDLGTDPTTKIVADTV